jgi:thiamine-monophosphate kinase
MSTATPLGPGREFDAIRELIARWGPRARGIGDDAAVLTVPDGAQLVVSTDGSVERVHFRGDWMTPREIGYRATAAALSDLAAMGASPLGVLVALTIPPDWRGDLPALADGIGEAAEACEAPIVGGDLSGGGELAVVLTVFGAAVTPLRRSGARLGDRICVTGQLGGPGRAIRDLAAGRTPAPEIRDRLVRPVPRIREARWLAARGATAAIDISDGLVADAGHLAAASDARIEIDLDRIPRLRDIEAMDAAASGEEYELLVAVPPSAPVHDFEASFRVPLTEIGRVVGHGTPGVETVRGGVSVAPPKGYDHFS